MIRLPLSVHARVAFLAIISVVATLYVTANSIESAVETVVSDNLDVKLDTQIRVLQEQVAPDGSFSPERVKSFPALAKPDPGWGWHVATPLGHWDKGEDPGKVEYPLPYVHVDDGIFSGRGNALGGRPIHVRRLVLSGANGPGTITVVSPRALIDFEVGRVHRAINRVLELVLAVLALSTFLQLRIGLGPLRKLRNDIAKVGRGEAQALPMPQPADLQPLAREVNALIERNNASIETARLNAANLAHAVMTPLSTLSLQMEHEGASQESLALLEHITQRVSQHLRRTRNGAIGLGSRATADVAQVVALLRTTILLMAQGRGLDVRNLVQPPCTASVDAEDLSDMLGNLMENASRYANSCIVVSAREENGALVVSIEDDGPGIAEQEIATALQPGHRLDEQSRGFGLGLAMTGEMAHLYGGTLALTRSDRHGGLCATLTLPA